MPQTKNAVILRFFDQDAVFSVWRSHMEGRRLVVLCVSISLFSSVAANLFVWMLFVAPLLGANSQYRQMIDRDRNEIAAQRKEFGDWMRDEFVRQDREALGRFEQQLAASEQRIAERIGYTMTQIERSIAPPRPPDATQSHTRKTVATELPSIPVAE